MTMDSNDVREMLKAINRNTLLTAKEVLTIDDVALLTGYSKNYLHNLMAKREIPFYKRKGGRPFFKKSEINDWLTQGYQPTVQDIEVQDFLQNYINS